MARERRFPTGAGGRRRLARGKIDSRPSSGAFPVHGRGEQTAQRERQKYL